MKSKMEEAKKFLSTVYLGDRGCCSILIDGVGRRLVVHVDCISRIRDPSGEWNYYTDEDIENGRLVFEGLKNFQMNPHGLVPNDYINYIRIDDENTVVETANIRFLMSIGSIAQDATSREVVLDIIAEGVHLEDPSRPGETIT